MATDISSIYGSNVSYFKEIKEKAFNALSSLEMAALGIAASGTIYDRIDPLTDVPTFDKIDINSIPTVAEVLGTIKDISPDQFPTAPDQNEIVKYKKHIWESAQLDLIESTLMNYMADMGMPSQDFQDAIFDESKERKHRAFADAADLLMAATSGRGFKYANGQTNAALLKLSENLQDDLTNQDREITKLMTDWARQNLQFSIQQGIAVEQAHMDFAYKYSSIFRELYTTMITAILEKYRTQIQMEIAKIEAVVKAASLRYEAMKANADIGGTEIKLSLEKDKLEIEQSIAQFNGNIQDSTFRAQTQVNATQHRATTSSAMVQAVSNSVIGIKNEK